MKFKENIDKIWEFLDKDKITCACFTDQLSVRYLAGYSGSFYDDPAILIVSKSHEPIMIVPETQKEEAQNKSFIKDLRIYNNYDSEKEINKYLNMSKAISQILNTLISQHRIIGVEYYFPLEYVESLKRGKPDLTFKDISTIPTAMRLIKTDDEIDFIRNSVKLADLGHYEMNKFAEEGKSEIEIFSMLRAKMEVEAGSRIHIKADLVAGGRSEDIGGHPGAYRVKRGDLIIGDLQPCLDDYWADTTSTIIIGEPTKQQKRIHKIVSDALQIGIESIKPGIKASHIDNIVRDYVKKYGHSYPHHTGHGVGLSNFEAPLIGPSSNSIIKDGMVITIEPGIYERGVGGLRLEDTILVTKNGAEVLSQHSKDLA